MLSQLEKAGVTLQSFETNDITFRRVSVADIDSLVDICRAGFPNTIRWQGPRFVAKKFCKVWLDSSSSETWVSLSRGEVVGFLVLVFDSSGVAKETREQGPGLLARMSALMFCPKVVLSRVTGLAISYIRKNKSIPVTARTNTQPPDSDCSEGRNVIWIRPMAVSPHKRRHGFGREILRFSEVRALELKYQMIKLSVENRNEPAMKLYERTGFTRTSAAKDQLYYTKLLT